MKSWQIFLKKSAGNGSGFYCILAKSFKILANFLKKQETEVACKVF